MKTELTPEDVRRLAATLGLALTPDDLAEVTHRLNGLLEALEPLRELPLHEVEPTPVQPDDGGLP